MTQYVGIRSEGGLIPYDVLDKIAKEESGLGQQAKDFGLLAGRRLTDEIARAWSDAQDYWHIFQRRAASLPESETGTTLTRKWISDLLNEQLLGYELTYQPSGALIGGKNYPISHRAGAGEESPPIQIEGFRTDLDKRPEGRRLSPQALVQEYLNNSDSHLWGIVSNGFLLRLLRDTSRTSRPSYLEFDLQSILEGNRFNEFALFYRVCHRTRLPRTAEDSPSCWLEKFFQLSIEQGGRVRDKLRDGVEDALKTLGTGFLRHPKNEALRERVKTGTLTSAEFHRQLLRLVYRLLFLMVAEERRMIVPEGPEADRRQSLFDRYYSVGRLRSLAEKAIEPSTFGDLWIGLQQTFALFEDGDSNPLGIPPLNGDLFSAIAIKDLQGTHLYNNVLLGGMGRLSLFEDHRVRQRVNYSALDVEELGSVYESLLDFQPLFMERSEGVIFELRIGSDRKSTGSYYTRPELVHELIESALVPVMRERLAEAKDSDPIKERDNKQHAILSMSVCDPACGSGHFLLAAARRLGRELAKVRTGEDEPTPQEFHLAVRDVIAHCVHGVDVNPLAVDLCKLALWLEGHWTGKPLSFLDHHIKGGNSLIGVLNMEALGEGIPDEAFSAVFGDDKKVANAFKKKNREERRGQPSLPFDAAEHVHQYSEESARFLAIPDDSPSDVRRKKEAYEKTRQRPDWWHDWVAANLWTAAFFLPLVKYDEPTIPTHDKFLSYVRGRHVNALMEGAAIGLATELRFFHWPLEFPDVMASGGFDVMLGNPPWERIKLQEQEFFAQREPGIAEAPTAAARGCMVEQLRTAEPGTRQRALYKEFEIAKHISEASSVFARGGGRFPLTGCGDVNTYALFAELFTQLPSARGRAGFIVPTGIATDSTTSRFFAELIEEHRLVQLVDFENRQRIFPAIDSRIKFSLLTIGRNAKEAGFAFFLTSPNQLTEAERCFSLSVSEIARISPNTKTAPIFRSRTDAELTSSIYKRVPVLLEDKKAPGENPWSFDYMTKMFDMADSSAEFRTATQLKDAGLSPVANKWEDKENRLWVPLYEAKMIHHFDHRWATYDGESSRNLTVLEKSDSSFEPFPRYWLPEARVIKRIKTKEWERGWLMGWRDITNATNERTVIAALYPAVAIGHSIRNMFVAHPPRSAVALLACLSSLPLDYVARQILGGTHLTVEILKQLPILPPSVYTESDIDFIVRSVLELAYTSHSMASLAHDLGYDGPPFPWDEDRRAQLRAELDAWYARSYGLTRDELRYILDPKDVFGESFPSETFRVLKEREQKEYGEYRTQRLVLEAFDKLADSPRFGDEMFNRESTFKVPALRTE